MAPAGRVLIAHPDPLARAYMRGLAESQLRLAAVEADSFDTLLAQLREEPGIVLVIVDLDLPGMSWEVGLRYLAAQHHGVRIVVLSGGLGQDTLDALATNGIAALVSKQLPEASLIEVLARVVTGLDELPYSASNSILCDHRADADFDSLDQALTTRQRDVMRFLSQGHSNRDIAKILGIAEGTVKVHVNAAFRVLGVHNRVSATVAYQEYSATH